MKRSSFALTFAAVAAAAIFSQVHAAAPAPSAAPDAAAAPGAGPAGGRAGRGGGRGGAGAAAVTVTPGMPGYPGAVPVDPAVGRKAKWPIRDAEGTAPEGYTRRASGGNGYYRYDAQGAMLPGTDLYNWADSGHFTNYDQNDIPPYTLPDALVMQDGRRVTTADMWFKERRPELVNLFKDNIYGRVPEDKLPKMKWEVKENEKSDDGKFITKVVIGYFEGTENPTQPQHVDPNAAGQGGRGGFGGGGGRGRAGAPGALGAPGVAAAAGAPAPGRGARGRRGGAGAPNGAAPGPAVAAGPGAPGAAPGVAGAPAAAGRAGRGGGRGFGGGGGGNTINITLILPNTGKPVPVFSGGPVNDPLGHGWGNLSITGNAGLLAKINPPEGQEKPDNFPGQYAITGWTFSKAMDYLEKDPDVDSRHVTIAGASTGGKQVLYTAAMEPRIWCVVPESSGAMGVKLNRRDIGETVDNLAVGNFAGNYAPHFKKYIGHWNDMPTDQHEMIALLAPRKVFITGGNQEQWEDVKGGWLAAVAAEPVYNLLGKRGVGSVEMPPIENPIMYGEIGFYQHNGGHMYTTNERQWVTRWMESYLGSTAPQ